MFPKDSAVAVGSQIERESTTSTRWPCVCSGRRCDPRPARREPMRDQSVPVGALPTVGTAPDSMAAQVVRSDRMGEPHDAFVVVEARGPGLGPRDVLTAAVAAR